MDMKVCVVMATYAGSLYIEQQLRSIFEQTHPPDKIVVRDDASSDGTVLLVKELSVDAPCPVEIIEGVKNLGYGANFAAALRRAYADVYFFADQDDVWSPDKIERHLVAYDHDPSLLVVISNQEIVGPDLQRTGRTSLSEIQLRWRGSDSEFVHGCCTSFRHLLYKPACAPPPDLAHDDWVHLLASLCGRRRVISDVLQLYRRHDLVTTFSEYNSFVPVRKGRSRTSLAAAVRNLKRREAFYRAAEAAISTLDCLPEADRTRGLETARKGAQSVTRRAELLNRGIKGLPSMLEDAVRGRTPIRTSCGDIARVILQKIR